MKCEACSNEHDGSFASGRFCSISCSRSFATRAKRTEINEKVSEKLGKYQISFCKACKKEFVRQPGYTRRRCPDCPDGRWQKQPFEVLKTDGARKKRLLQERGLKCEVCGITEWEGRPTPIQLDHIDGHPGHNEKTNLRLICPNCHAQTEHYCGANVGKHSGTKRQKTMARYPNYRAQKTSHLSLGETEAL